MGMEVQEAGLDVITKEGFGLANQFLASGHSIRCDLPCLRVQIVVSFQTRQIVAGARVRDQFVGFRKPLSSLPPQISLNERMIKYQ